MQSIRSTQIIHFTEVATDPLKGFSAHGVRLVQLAEGVGETYVSSLHLEPGGWIADPPADRDTTLLVVDGAVTFVSSEPTMRLRLSGGMGMVMSTNTRYRLHSEWGAILLVVEAKRLEPAASGISTPERIMEAVWPGERGYRQRRRRTFVSMVRWVYYRWKWRKVRRMWGADISGWGPALDGDTVGAAVSEVFGRDRFRPG